MKIAITGASGFVGTNLQKYLKKSLDIKTMSVRYVKNQQFDLNVDGVIHLAGKAHDLISVSDPKEYYEANFELTVQLFDAFLASEAKVFIFMSTVKAVADNVQGVLTEDAVPNPQTHYGIAKQQAEQYILSMELPPEKRVYILRPCMIHGHGNKGNLNLLYQFVSKSLPWPLGAFDNERSYLSIENLCFVIKELLLNKLIPTGIYQVSDDQSLSTNELIKMIGHSLGVKSRLLKVPKNLVVSVAKLGDYLNLPLNTERLRKLTESYVVGNQKILKVIGKKLPVSTEDGLMKTFLSFKK